MDAELESRLALDLHRASGDREHEVMTLIARGRGFLQQGQFSVATQHLNDALDITQRLKLPMQESEAHRWLSAALEGQRLFEEALLHHKAFYELQNRLHNLTLDRKTKMLTVEANVSALRREAELERERRTELEGMNADLRRAEEEVRHLADHDTLTGLPNRKLFTERLVQVLKLTQRVRARHGVMFVDLDGFKRINDTWGHAAGHELLQQVAARLLEAVRASDTVARFAGDEFVVLAQAIADVGTLQVVADRIVEVLGAPFELGEAVVHIGASVGYACSPDHAQDLDHLLRCADTAMYEAKRTGKNRACVYAPPQENQAAAP